MESVAVVNDCRVLRLMRTRALFSPDRSLRSPASSF